MTKRVLVYIEVNNNKVEKVSKEIVSKALSSFADTEINGIVICDDATLETVSVELKKIGLNKLFVLQDNLFDNFQTCLYSKALTTFLSENQFDVFLMGATENGRDLAPRAASILDIGLTADCTDLELGEDGSLLATRPTYGGQLMATIISKTKPNFATIRAGAFKYEQPNFCDTEFVFVNPDVSGLNSLIEVLKCERKPEKEDWTCADVILAGGLGLQNKENFELIYRLAEKLNAKPAASRAAIEQGWAPHDIQVGQTGNSVSPKLYIAFGISGALQHMTGVANADRIIAVNIDKNAPIMSASDTAIVADAVSVLKSMV